MLLMDIEATIATVFDDTKSAISLREAIKQPIHKQSLGIVVPIAERPSANVRDEDIGRPLQKSEQTFGVVIGFKSINDATGAVSMEALDALRKSLREKLYGFQYPKHTPIMLGPSDLINFVPGGLWWIDRFTTSTYYQGMC